MRGALLTIDRPYGPIFDHLHHKIGSTHVAHHVDSMIPHYVSAQLSGGRTYPACLTSYLTSSQDVSSPCVDSIGLRSTRARPRTPSPPTSPIATSMTPRRSTRRCGAWPLIASP